MGSGHTHQDNKVDVKIQLAGLWTATLFFFTFVDIFGFFRADTIEGALNGELTNQNVTINQAFLVFAVGFVTPAILMIVVSLITKPPLNRILNIVVSLLYAILVAGLCIGEKWIYYLAGSFFEVILLLLIARTAWTWPHSTSST